MQTKASLVTTSSFHDQNQRQRNHSKMSPLPQNQVLWEARTVMGSYRVTVGEEDNMARLNFFMPSLFNPRDNLILTTEDGNIIKRLIVTENLDPGWFEIQVPGK